jgi:sigma-B regulation protein RsbU (phosphoserine phosphatase)
MRAPSASIPAPGSLRSWLVPRSFRAKFVLVAIAGVIFDLLLGGGSALWNVSRLGEEASGEIQNGLEKASNEYLENYIQTTALRANLLLSQVNSEVTTLAGSMQTLVDQPQAREKIGTALQDVPYFSGNLQFNSAGNWMQNVQAGEPSVVSIWGYLLGPDKMPRPDVAREVRETAVFDLIGTSLMRTGANKLQMYYIGSKERPIFRTTPYTHQAQTFDKLYPGHNEKNFWDFFFPGVIEGWQGWIKDAQTKPTETLVTNTEPYVDAITGNLIVSFFHPVWNKDRTDCEGAVGADITLQQLSDLIANVKVAETGFGFLAMSNGNVLAINGDGEKTLGIAIKNDDQKAGVTALDRTLGKSAYGDVRALQLPNTEKVIVRTIQLGEEGKAEPYVVVLRQLQHMNLWANGRIVRDHATLGFVVPQREIYGSLYEAQDTVSEATKRILHWQLALVLVSLAVVLGAVILVSRRITAGIVDLAQAAKRIQQKDYSVRVDIRTKDEVGQLGAAFNNMAEEIESYTTELERRVAERTTKLEAASREIEALNEKLKGENLRMSAELDVARRMQMMVLPRPEELCAVPRLDIAGHMEPASEVGGDYYDVLQHNSRVKIGIGDVTGHGLESGVLMLMVQSVARTLLESGEDDPKRFLSVLNQVICKNVARTQTGNNLTLSFLDYTENRITLTGQHEEVIVIRENGDLERIDTIDLGFPVGLEPEIAQFIHSRNIRFESGDLMILYTDGVTEAESPQGELFGIERLCESARLRRQESATEIKQGIVRDVLAHIDTQRVHDDITLVVLKHH